MKKTLNSIFFILLVLTLVISVSACNGTENNPAQESSNVSEQAENNTSLESSNVSEQTETPQVEESSAQVSEVEKTGVWENATYTSDKEFGEGSKVCVVEVSAEGQKVTFSVNTDKSTVGEALLAEKLIAGDDGQYGLYVKIVNGITADYDVDQSYWAFYIDGEYAMMGVDTTEITEGVVYKLEYTKG